MTLAEKCDFCLKPAEYRHDNSAGYFLVCGACIPIARELGMIVAAARRRSLPEA